jgi:tripartite-type tricarboxylate transporter receptor subunit TctC
VQRLSLNAIVFFLFAIASCAACAQGAGTGKYPTRPIRFISPFLPGGSQDVIARIVGTKLGERLQQQVVVDNRSGAAGIIATELTVRAQPDGYTLLMITAGPITIAPSLQKKLPYDPLKDLAPVIHLVDTPMALIVNPTLPAKSVAELVALGRARPGKINYASVGNGSISHLTMELFKMQSALDFNHVPYKGAAPAFVDLFSGQVSLIFITTASAQPHTSAGKARALAVAARKRSTMMPDVPTLTEAGIKGLDVPVWTGVATTGATPKPIIDLLYREFAEVLKLPDVRERLEKLGSDINGGSPAELGALLRDDLARWARVIKTANIRLD